MGEGGVGSAEASLIGADAGLGSAAAGATGAIAGTGALGTEAAGVVDDGFAGTTGRAIAGWAGAVDCVTILASPLVPNKSPTSAGAFKRFSGARRVNALGPMSERIVCRGNST